MTGVLVTVRQVLDVIDMLDRPVRGDDVAQELKRSGLEVTVTPVTDHIGSTDFLSVTIPGSSGRLSGGTAPTTGIVGRLGGIGARPAAVGMVSDADGAIAVLAAAMKLGSMRDRGDQLPGDVIVTTHVCPDAPTQPHDPVPFMGSPVDMATMNRLEVRPEMDVVLSVDATKGNRVVNHKGIAITPTIKSGWVLPVSDDLLDIYQQVTGHAPVVVPITTFDITPYGNGLSHVNSIVQPAVATDRPVVGVAVTAEVAVPGCATGANHASDVALAATFCIEVAKAVGADRCRFYDPDEFALATAAYGDLARLQGADPANPAITQREERS
jgi:hypothetical protein